ncbi:MAG: A/G-specific adenine glycosylase [Crocinitomicaceae bacterium]|nr:A/G-specific adenine glycosylase [Flavobacteriales bacterium]NQZ38017.1 A/G-specific adenine glycosylase [Crocinitomicaceae bacterium]
MADFHLLIADWYRQNHRELPWRDTKNPYFIWLSEIIMQQTRIEQGLNYYLKFTNAYPTIQNLANASEQDVLNNWQGLGYYSRARNLHFSAKFVVNELNGKFPATYNEIMQLKGVGTYTAAAVASFAYNERCAVVDGNVYRFLSRLFDIATPIDSTQGKKEFQLLADELIKKADPGTHNQAMMEMGSLICSPKPDCEACPVQVHCLAIKNKTISERPIKSKKTKVRDRYFHYLVHSFDGKTIITKRTEKGIWQNMYQFPLIETESAETPGAISNEISFSSEVQKHILSHQRIFAVFHQINNAPKTLDSDHLEINKVEIQDYPLPRIIDRYLEDTANQ